MSATPKQVCDILASSAVQLSELAEATYLSALTLSPEERRFLGCVAYCLTRIATGEPLPAEALRLPLGAWLADELLRATDPDRAPAELGARLRRALEAAHATDAGPARRR